MSRRKEISKNDEYRKNKKINKSKIRDGQRSKNFLLHEDSILNTLPSGDFDKVKNKESYENHSIKDTINNINTIKDSIHNEDTEDNIYTVNDDDEFDDSYFEPIVYKK